MSDAEYRQILINDKSPEDEHDSDVETQASQLKDCQTVKIFRREQRIFQKFSPTIKTVHGTMVILNLILALLLLSSILSQSEEQTLMYCAYSHISCLLGGLA